MQIINFTFRQFRTIWYLTEKKITTLATIYGLIIQSRDHLASGIQRLYSSLAIRYHADNKVYCFILLIWFISNTFMGREKGTWLPEQLHIVSPKNADFKVILVVAKD
jgi:hypothetical protein